MDISDNIINNEDSVCIKQIGKGSFSNVYLFENKEYVSGSLNLSSIFTNLKKKEPFFIIKEMDLSKLVYKYLYKGTPVSNKIKYRPSFKNDKIKQITKSNEIEIESVNGIKIKKNEPLNRTTSVNITPYLTQTIKVNYTEEEYYYNRLRELIESEILILRNLNHDNIIKYFSSIIINDVYSIKMEYCELGDLYSLLKEKGDKNSSQFQKQIYDLKKHRNIFGGFTDNFVKDYIKDITNALLYINNMNIIHRDIKLHNILVKYSQNENKYIFKLSDFGFACYDLSDENFKKVDNNLCISSFLNITPESLERKYYKLCGTPYYMAPEVILNLNKFEQLIGVNKIESNIKLYNKKVDIWSFGICLYELIFNVLPFSNLSDMNDIKLFYTKKSSQDLIYTNINEKNILNDYLKDILKELLTIDPIIRIDIKSLSEIDFKPIFIKQNIPKIPKINIKSQMNINMNSWVFENLPNDTTTITNENTNLNLKGSWNSIKLTSSSLIMKMSVDKSFKNWLKQ